MIIYCIFAGENSFLGRRLICECGFIYRGRSEILPSLTFAASAKISHQAFFIDLLIFPFCLQSLAALDDNFTRVLKTEH